MIIKCNFISGKEIKPPVITDASGKTHTGFNFEFGENTRVYKSCSMTYRNEFLVFGGSEFYGGESRQISKISGCRLERIGTLDFDHYEAACTGVGDKRIYLCFDYDYGHAIVKCRYAENPLDTFTEARPSIYEHRSISIAASDCKSKTSEIPIINFSKISGCRKLFRTLYRKQKQS